MAEGARRDAKLLEDEHRSKPSCDECFGRLKSYGELWWWWWWEQPWFVDAFLAKQRGLGPGEEEADEEGDDDGEDEEAERAAEVEKSWGLTSSSSSVGRRLGLEWDRFDPTLVWPSLAFRFTVLFEIVVLLAAWEAVLAFPLEEFDVEDEDEDDDMGGLMIYCGPRIDFTQSQVNFSTSTQYCLSDNYCGTLFWIFWRWLSIVSYYITSKVKLSQQIETRCSAQVNGDGLLSASCKDRMSTKHFRCSLLIVSDII